MDVLALIIGIGIICFLLLYLSFNLDKSHTLLKILLFFLFLGALNLIPKAIIDNYDTCELVLNETQTSYIYGKNYTSYHWDYSSPTTPPYTTVSLFHENTTYTYSEVCITNTKETGNMLLRLSLFIWYICISYMLLYLVWEALKFAGAVVPNESNEKGLIKYKWKK